MKTSFHVISGRHEMLSRWKICGTVELWAENCFYINLPSFPFSHLHHHSTFRLKLLPLQGFKVSSHTSKQDDSTNISPITYQHVFQTNNQRRCGVLQRPRQQRQLQKQPRILQKCDPPCRYSPWCSYRYLKWIYSLGGPEWARWETYLGNFGDGSDHI